MKTSDFPAVAASRKVAQEQIKRYNTLMEAPAKSIVDLAKEAGFYFHDAGYAPVLHTVALEYSQACFERFAGLIKEQLNEV